jgi:hypothetical protein
MFETLPEAHDYEDILKTKILPKIRQLLDRRENRTPQTMEF